MQLDVYLQDRRQWIDSELDSKMPGDTVRPAELHAAMRYAILSGGKRLRPILCLAAAEAANGTAQTALPAALALELLHGYTLIHDDLPCMDDDDLRRGRPTVHVQYGESCAVLAGDALQALAFQWVAETSAGAPHDPKAIVGELAQAAGSLGVVGGQALDLAAENSAATADDLHAIHQLKTAALFRAAARIGGISAGAGPDVLNALTEYGQSVGLAFQMADDILNATGTEDQIGKPAGSDAERGKTTAVSVLGLADARTRGNRFIERAQAALSVMPGPTEPLAEIARFIVERGY